jgi:hypothetical protein
VFPSATVVASSRGHDLASPVMLLPIGINLRIPLPNS